MNITAGKYKGRKVKTLKTRDVRPTSSKIRESIFNMIQSSIAGSVMLDLFAGSGIMGLEALSRGASKVVYVERNSQVARLLKENLVNFNEEINLIMIDALVALDRLAGQSFDIIFVDPPYAAGLVEPVLQKIKNNNLLSEEGIIIVEHPPEVTVTKFAEDLGLSVYKEKRYGDTSITIVG